jgi:hypothetical protein
MHGSTAAICLKADCKRCQSQPAFMLVAVFLVAADETTGRNLLESRLQETPTRNLP